MFLFGEVEQLVVYQLLPNLAIWEDFIWLSSDSEPYLRNVFGAMSNVRANSIAIFQGSANDSLIRQPLLKD